MMWPIPALEHKFVSVLFFPDALVCCWIDKNARDKIPMIRAYKRYSLDNFELLNGMIFNPTIIKKYINTFLHEYNLHDAFVVFSLHGPAVTEQFIAMPTATPHYTDFTIAKNARSTKWEYRYLYPYENGQFMFYVYSVPRSVILQYQLLAIGAHCNVIKMTTHTACILSAYEYMFGSAFRRSQLAVDMMRAHHKIDALISHDALHRMMKIGTDINIKQERSYLAAAVGAWYSERIK